MNEIKYLAQVILSKGYWVRAKNLPATRSLNEVVKFAESAGSQPWWLAVKSSENSKNALGVFYIDSSLDGWDCIDWDESKIINLHDLFIEAKNLEMSESEESVI